MSTSSWEMRRPTKKELRHTQRFEFTDVAEVSSGQTESGVGTIPADEGELTPESPEAPSSELERKATEEPPKDVPQPELFDNLSKSLGREAAKLSEDDAEREANLRKEIFECLKNFSSKESELGRVLYEYRAIYKNARTWTAIAGKIGKFINRSPRTLYRMVDEFETSIGKAPNPEPKLDLRQIMGPDLEKQEVREFAARMAIRTFLNNLPKRVHRAQLSMLISEEAFQVWGERRAFDLHIEPVESHFTIDGRKKCNLNNSREVTN
jgi:hypothetical protein